VIDALVRPSLRETTLTGVSWLSYIILEKVIGAAESPIAALEVFRAE